MGVSPVIVGLLNRRAQDWAVNLIGSNNCIDVLLASVGHKHDSCISFTS